MRITRLLTGGGIVHTPGHNPLVTHTPGHTPHHGMVTQPLVTPHGHTLPVAQPPGHTPAHCMLGYTAPHPPHEQNNRQIEKHYLPATSFAGGKDDIKHLILSSSRKNINSPIKLFTHAMTLAR